MRNLFFIFIGGGTGSIFRHYLSNFIQGYFSMSFPFGTLGVNILACFILGLVAGATENVIQLSPVSRYLLITGFCGGFSTFSAFSFESLRLLQEEKYVYLITYIVVSIVFCIGATFAGMMIASRTAS